MSHQRMRALELAQCHLAGRRRDDCLSPDRLSEHTPVSPLELARPYLTGEQRSSARQTTTQSMPSPMSSPSEPESPRKPAEPRDPSHAATPQQRHDQSWFGALEAGVSAWRWALALSDRRSTQAAHAAVVDATRAPRRTPRRGDSHSPTQGPGIHPPPLALWRSEALGDNNRALPCPQLGATVRLNRCRAGHHGRSGVNI